MSSTTKVRKFKFFWADQVVEQERWLREMAQQGLHLQSVNVLCMWTFAKGEPADIVYRVDFNNASPDFIQLLQDAGWALAASLHGWQYWRTGAANGRAPELFTDTNSKKAKYLRLTAQVLLALFPVVLVTVNMGPGYVVSQLSWPFLAVIIALLGFSLVGLVRLLARLMTMRSD